MSSKQWMPGCFDSSSEKPLAESRLREAIGCIPEYNNFPWLLHEETIEHVCLKHVVDSFVNCNELLNFDGSK
jgi:hypothetical protein